MILSKPNYRIKEVATYAGVSRSTVRKWIDAGSVESIRLPTGERRIPRTAMERLIADLKLRDDPWTEYAG